MERRVARAARTASAWLPLIVSASGLACFANAAPPTYQVIDIGDLGGRCVFARAINDSGQIVGRSATTSSCAFWLDRAFLYGQGTMTALAGWEARDINNLGQVVGATYGPTHAFLYSGGVTTDLGTLGGNYSQANSINDSGQIVGNSTSPAGSFLLRAFRYSDATGMVDLGALPGGEQSEAKDINAAGEIAGRAQVPYGGYHAIAITTTMIDIAPALDDPWDSRATAIDDDGNVYGVHDFGAFEYSLASGTAKLLALPTGWWGLEILGANRRGERVGTAWPPYAWGPVAVIYKDGTVRDLNTLVDPADPAYGHLTLTNAVGINRYGWIAANGYDNANYVNRAYLVRPRIDQLILALKARVTEVGPGTSLSDKLSLVLTYYQASNNLSACGLLEDFVSQVTAQAGKKIETGLASDLTGEARSIALALACSP